MLLLYKSYNYINKHFFLIKSRVVGRGARGVEGGEGVFETPPRGSTCPRIAVLLKLTTQTSLLIDQYHGSRPIMCPRSFDCLKNICIPEHTNETLTNVGPAFHSCPRARPTFPANMRHRNNVVVMLVHRLRRWPNIFLTPRVCLVLTN